MLSLNFTPFPVLTTERLLLRQLTEADEEDIFTLRSDESVNRYLDRIKARSVEDARKFIRKINNNIANNEAVFWGISFKDDTRTIGTACLWNIDVREDIAEIGYELLPAYQGKGLMQEALEKVIEYGFDTLKAGTIQAFANKKNEKSARLLERLGFVRDRMKENDPVIKKESGNARIYVLKTR